MKAGASAVVHRIPESLYEARAKPSWAVLDQRLVGVFLLLFPFWHDLRRIQVGWNRHAEEADHHFFPALVSPLDRLGRIGIVHVIRRVIEVCGARNSGAPR